MVMAMVIAMVMVSGMCQLGVSWCAIGWYSWCVSGCQFGFQWVSVPASGCQWVSVRRCQLSVGGNVWVSVVGYQLGYHDWVLVGVVLQPYYRTIIVWL